MALIAAHLNVGIVLVVTTDLQYISQTFPTVAFETKQNKKSETWLTARVLKHDWNTQTANRELNSMGKHGAHKLFLAACVFQTALLHIGFSRQFCAVGKIYTKSIFRAEQSLWCTVSAPDLCTASPGCGQLFFFLHWKQNVMISLDHIQLCVPSHQVRSSVDTRFLRFPSTHLRSSGPRAFCHQAPLLWKSLRYYLRHSSSMASFKSVLETHLFSSGLGPCLCARGYVPLVK